MGGVPIFDLQEIAGKAAAMGIHPEQGTTLRDIGVKDLITREILLGILGETETHASELADFSKRSSDTR